ncbi:hypothetical protein BZZ77_24460 [Salmonella enterica subsp. enterica serovar Saintpaul]|nr:hypothetical protein [Salmonella enterica subsp. enterica serovar Saintpaul]
MRGFMGIIAAVFLTASASATTSVEDLLPATPYQYNPPSFEVCTGDDGRCEEVSRHDEYILVHAKGEETCPAGYYFLLNSKAQEIVPVETITCDPTLRASLAYNTKTKQRLLVIEQQGEVRGSIALDQ